MAKPKYLLVLSGIFEINHGSHTPLRAIEGLRGLAVTLVFLVHYVTLGEVVFPSARDPHGLAHALHALGHAGVDLFFVLSGFLIYGMLISRQQAFLTYFKRRIERLYPTFLAVLSIYLLLSWMFPAESKIPAEPIAAGLYIGANLLMLPGIFAIEPIVRVAWSLSYEMAFYLAVPALIAVFHLYSWSPERRMALILFILAGWAVCNISALHHIRVVMFVAGMLLYEHLKIHRPFSSMSGILALLAGFATIHLLTQAQLPGQLRYVVLFLSFFAICSACFGSMGTAYRLFCWTPIRWLGNMSYSYYLIHGLILKAEFLMLSKIIPPGTGEAILYWTLLPLMFGTTLVGAAALFVAVERPFSLEVGRTRNSRYEFLHKALQANDR